MTETLRKLAATLSEQLVSELAAEMDELRLVDRETASAMLGISPMTFERLRMPRIKFGDSQSAAVRYRLTDIKRMIEQRTERRAGK